MSKVNLEKELLKRQDNTIKQNQSLVEVSKQLLASNEMEERQALAKIGLDRNLSRYETQKDKALSTQKVLEEYGSAITLDAIHDLCLTYRLRLAPASKFNDHHDPMIGPKLMEFSRKHTEELVEYNWYVLAPYSAFSDSEDFSFTRPMNVMRQKANEAFRTWASDPVLLYRKDAENFAIVHKWGDDFSDTRRLQGLIMNKPTNLWLAIIFLLAIATASMFIFGQVAGIATLVPSILTIAVLGLFIFHDENKKVFTAGRWAEDRRYDYNFWHRR